MKKSFHALIDAKNIKFDICVNDSKLLNILIGAATCIDATIISTNRYRFGHNSPNGCTTFLMLDESHMSAHTYADEGKIAFDIFTCIGKDKCEKAARYIINELKIKDYTIDIVERFV